MDFNEIKTLMKEQRDEKNAVFFKKLSPTAVNVTGVRIPYIRKLAKELVKTVNIYDFYENYKAGTHEEFILKGLVLAYSKVPLDDKLNMLKDYICKINDWSACDTVIPSFKFKDNELSNVYSFIMQYKKSQKEYEVRVLIVMMMKYFLRDEYIDNVIETLNEIKIDSYYSQMAAAWLVSEMFVKNREKAVSLLAKNNFDEFTQNKAVQKIKESFRVSKEDKEYCKRFIIYPSKK